MLCQQRNVPAPGTQRGQGDAQRGQAVIQIAAEAPGRRALLQRLQGGGHHAQVDRGRFGCAHAQHFALFQHAQQAGLQRQRQFADLIQEQGAAICGLDQADAAAAPRAGEGAIAVAEQLRLQQRFADGATVQRDEAPTTTAGGVQLACHQFLAGAGFATDQHGAVVRCIKRDLCAYLCHRIAVAEQFMRVGPYCRAPAWGGSVATGAGQRLGQFQRMLERLPHRVGRVQQHAGQAGLFGVIDGHAGADDHFDAIGAQVSDAVAGVLAGDETAMLDIQAETLLEVAEHRYVAGVGDQADAAGDPSCPGQRFHQVEAVGLDRHQRQLQPAAQPGRVGAACDDHVAVLAAQALADHVHGFLETEVDLFDARAAVELRNDVAEQTGQPRNADGPDHRATGVGVGVAQGRAGQIHGGVRGTGCFMIHLFQCFICFTTAWQSCP